MLGAITSLLPVVLGILNPASSGQSAQGQPVAFNDDNLFGDLVPPTGDILEELTKQARREAAEDANYEDFGAPFERDVSRALVDYDRSINALPSVGNPVIDAVLRTVGVGSANSVKGAIDSVKALGQSVAREFKRVDDRISSVKAQADLTTKRIATHAQMISRLDMAWRAQFGEQSRWKKAALFVINQLPGLRSYNMLTSPQFIAVCKWIVAMVKDSDDFTLGAPTLGAVPAAGASYVQADMNAILTAINANITAQNTAIAAICQYLGDRAEAADDLKVEELVGQLQTYAVKDVFGQIAGIAPGQLEDREQAIGEGLGKQVLGGLRAPGTSLLSGLI